MEWTSMLNGLLIIGGKFIVDVVMTLETFTEVGGQGVAHVFNIFLYIIEMVEVIEILSYRRQRLVYSNVKTKAVDDLAMQGARHQQP